MTVLERITATLVELETLDAAGRADLIRITATATGGTVKDAKPGDAWDSQRVEIYLHGIIGEGADWAEAIRNWTRAATNASNARARIEVELRDAVATLEHPGPVADTDMIRACETILGHPHLVAQVQADRARALLHVLQTAA